jgi:hypothetical protein
MNTSPRSSGTNTVAGDKAIILPTFNILYSPASDNTLYPPPLTRLPKRLR